MGLTPARRMARALVNLTEENLLLVIPNLRHEEAASLLGEEGLQRRPRDAVRDACRLRREQTGYIGQDGYYHPNDD